MENTSISEVEFSPTTIRMTSTHGDIEQIGFWTAWSETLFVIGMIILSLSSNLLLSFLVLRRRWQNQMHHLYMVSINAANMLHALTNFPASVLYRYLLIPPNNMDQICVIWIFFETFICHTTLLTLLGSSLDNYLQLSMPVNYAVPVRISRTAHIKILVPWFVSFFQTSIQIVFGDPVPPSRMTNRMLCTCPDVNFLILRTCVAFVIPLVASVVVLFMAACKLRKFYKIKVVLEGLNDTSDGISSKDTKTAKDALFCEQQETNAISSKLSDICVITSDHVQSEALCGVPNTEHESHSPSNGVSASESKVVKADHAADASVFVEYEVGSIPNSLVIDHFCPAHGLVTVPVHTTESAGWMLSTIERSSPQMALEEASDKLSSSEDVKNSNEPMPLISDTDHSPFRRSAVSCDQLTCDAPNLIRLEEQKSAIKLNMVTCSVSIALWAPYITATMAYLLLTVTSHSYLISVNTLTKFKWLAYVASIVYPIGYLLVDYKSILTVEHGTLHKEACRQMDEHFSPSLCLIPKQ